MTDFTPEEQKLHTTAMTFAKANKNKKRIARAKVDIYPKEQNPVSVFMAGSPGAGKTETSKSLIKNFKGNILRIDNDELRSEFTGYIGSNSHVFQAPATRLLEAIHDQALKRDVSFVLDTTLSSYIKAKQNIERSLKRKRPVMIIFVYQDPEQAWKFVESREITEGRRVPPKVFIEQFISSQETVNKLKQEFGKNIKVELLIKNIDGSHKSYYSNVQAISSHLKKLYNHKDIQKIIKAI
jgi:predicted ABC-type ATPase